MFYLVEPKKTNHMMKRFSLLFIALWIVSCTPKVVDVDTLSEEDRWSYRAKNTEIIRDDFGVPHIYGKTDADAVFGMLYAQCEDDFNRVERNYIWAIGRLAEVEGEKALYSDLRARLYMTQAEAEENFTNSPKWLQDLCVAFADGVNYYLQTHPEVKPKLLTRFEPWMPMYFSEGSIGGDIERVSTRRIKQFYGKQEDKLAVHDGLIRLKDDEPRGSNGFAISGSKTKSGNAMLLINPHTSFFFRGELHVVSEEGLNAYGATTWGQFFIYQGFNEKTGWMHTSTGTDIIDQFEETIVKNEKGLHYKYGEELRPIDSISVSLNYKTDGGKASKDFTMYRTHHGPITHADGDKWISTALMWKPIKALEQSFTRTKKSNHTEFHEMMNIRTNSSNNTVYADADGTIAYYHGNFIPKRDVQFDYSKPVDGSNPQTDWQGLHDLEETIIVKNPPNGWIQNCNSTPFTSAAEYSPKKEDYPYYMATFPENFRGIHAIPLLTKAEGLTLDSLIYLAYDPYLPGADKLITGLLEAYKANPNQSEEIKEAMEVLQDWDFTVSKESVAMTLTQFYLNAFYESGSVPRTTGNKRSSRLQRFEYMSNLSTSRQRLEVFQFALAKLKFDFGTWKTPWGEFNRYQRLNGDIRQQFDDAQPSIPVGMASGRWGALASYGTRFGKDTKRQYGTSGNSFVAVVEFGEKVQAKTMLAGGQSGDPSSPHFSDQAQRYADGQFKDVAYYKEDVLKKAQRTYHPGEK
jgi:acyl-homoserine lactone acylase PvdQ